MISTDLKRVQIKTVVENQLPSFVREDFPLVTDFIKQYYVSQDYIGSSSDLIQNIDQYIKLDSLLDNRDETELRADISFFDTSISVKFDIVNNDVLGTYKFPEKYGLIQIDDEIILYTSKTNTSFEGCVRGFSGVTSYTNQNNPDTLVFSTSNAADHKSGAKVKNLSSLFLKEFLKKIKYQFTPGFENREFDSQTNTKLFISRAKDFYASKGTDTSFKILFSALYGERVDVIKPKDHLFRPSDSDYRITKDIVVESISGNPLQLLNNTLYQDEYDNYGITKSYGSVTDVEKISVSGKNYYKLSLDLDYDKDINLEGSVFGSFSVHPRTRLINSVSVGSSTLDVDSTLGFPNSGELKVVYSNGSEGLITYENKSTNQFFGVKNITSTIDSNQEVDLNVFAYGYVGIDTSNQIKVRITSVLSNVKVSDKTYYFSKNDTGRIKSLGITTESPRTSNWIYNIPLKFNVSNYTLIDSSSFTYRITTYDKHNFRIGDLLTIDGSSSNPQTSKVVSVSNDFTFSINGQGELKDDFYTVERKILKPVLDSKLSNYNYIQNYNTDVQNTYVKFDNSVLVSSASLPYYNNQPLSFNDRKLNLNGNFIGTVFNFSDVLDHGYYTGDSVYYKTYKVFDPNTEQDVESKFSNLQEGIYYVKRIDANRFSLATSPANIYNNNFISVSGIVTSNYFIPTKFANKNLQHQKLLREIKSPINESGNYTTEPGCTGILVNGVEILNYKSEDYISYGQIESIDVFSAGRDYDVINPPTLSIQDDLGSGASGKCAVNGNLVRIDILDSGFDYVSTPVVTISGGNGFGAKAEVNTSFIDHSVSFNATSESNLVNLSSDSIGFSTFHKFRNAESIIYKTDGGSPVSGLVNDSKYFVKVIDEYNVQLYKSEYESIVGINTINLLSYGTGVHRLQSTNKKQIITNIVVTDSGNNYQNKERSISSSGISTASNQINIKNHGYESREIVVYYNNGVAISGLIPNEKYIVTKVDNDNFKLSKVGVSSVSKYFYYETNQYINFDTKGSGTHTFNYEPIEVAIQGEIGVSTFSGQDFGAKIQPIFRGKIDSINLVSSGSGYGTQDIINYDRQPLITLSSGSSAQILPIVNNGKIVEALVINPGSGYNSPPDLVVDGEGKYGKLVPVVKDGKIVSVKISNGGIGYGSKTKVNVISPGLNASFKANIQRWTVNLFERYLNIISPDDGILTESINDNFGIEYCHLYSPRKLRESLYVKDSNNQIRYGIFDLQKDNNQNEKSSSYHSPIIGWSYDGNPIYGPYGFSNKNGGFVKAMESGYKVISKANRPSTLQFPLGFFVEDYVFQNSGDLDEHNGRFCITPEFPNGVYAYFSTINPNLSDDSGVFAKYRRPVFPYLIGNSFKSKPNTFNFKKDSNQDVYNLNNSEWFRNTSPYGLTNKNTEYSYLLQPNKIKESLVDISRVSQGSIQSIGIVTGGNDYRVGDIISFESNSNKTNARAKVSSILGKTVSNVSTSSTTFYQVEFGLLDSFGSYIGFTTYPHNLLNLDTVNISGLSSYSANIQGSYSVGVSSESFILSANVDDSSITGIVTYFKLSGNLNFPNIRENDTLVIDNEQLKVLNVDQRNSRIRVLREHNGTVGSAHSSLTTITSKTRVFKFNTNNITNSKFELDSEIYFNPVESLGIGSVSGIGIGNTLYFSNPGSGLTQLFIPTQSIYLPDHNLNTGDSLIYSVNDTTGSSIKVSNDGLTSFDLGNKAVVYVAKISKDLIGISTFKVGIGTTGTFVGVASTTSNSGTLYFTGIGTGVYHSFKTRKENVVLGEVSRNLVTVSVASSHQLSLNDSITLNVKPNTTKTIVVKYNDYNRRIVFDPKSFISANVDIDENTIEITNHELNTGDKVIHTSSSPCGGLVDEKIYYVIYYSKNKIKLANSLYQSKIGEFVDISSSSFGTISQINPLIKLYKNSKIKFDLSDSSLSFTNSSTQYSAFDLGIYNDSEFKNIFEKSENSKSFEVTKIGTIGITPNASLTIDAGEYLNDQLYYKFNPVNLSLSPQTKSEIIIDTEVSNFNKIEILDSLYSGKHVISNIPSNTSFEFNLENYPESSSYSAGQSSIIYSTNSTTSNGSIFDVTITYQGSGYDNVVGISSIKTDNGYGAILEPSSENIGTANSLTLMDIGFDYPTDKTLRPICNLPEILSIEPLASFAEIGITSSGKNYNIEPNLVVLDGFTNKVVNDVKLSYNLGDTKVKILQNTFGIYDTTPKIIPTNNSNGVGIKSITYNPLTNEVTVGLNTGFSDEFPFSVGDKVLIENISVGIGTTAKGYNSSNYGYDLFTLTKVPFGNSGLGGNVGVVTYSMDGYLNSGEIPGNFDNINSSGRIVAEKDFPKFSVKLKKNDFAIGETVYTDNNIGVVESWNNKINLLKVSSNNEFNVGDVLVGKTTKTQGSVRSKIDFNAEIITDSSSIVKKGWKNEVGFLNYDTERIPDNFYYQNFSYSLKSKIPFDTWKDPVSSLNHPSGFLKFSDLVIESNDINFKGVFVDSKGSNVDVTIDLYNEIDLNCYNNFDLVTENSLNLGSYIISDEIYFNSKVLTDYFESFGNRVLNIDDISSEFNSNPRPTKFSIVDIFNIESRYKKYFVYARDKRFTGERQVSIVSLFHKDGIPYISQYGRVESQIDLGSFDFNILGAEGQLLFYPTKYQVNDYDVTHVSFDTIYPSSGIGSTSIGDIVKIASNKQFAPSSSTTSVVSIDSSYRTNKLILEVEDNRGKIQVNEVSLIHDGTNVEFLEYGQIGNHSTDSFGDYIGLGTYNAYISSGKVVLDFTPNPGIAATVTSIVVSIANSTSTGVGTIYLGVDGQNTSILKSSYVSIASSTSPVENIIATYNNVSPEDNSASYFIVSVEDITNNDYQMSEVIVLDDSIESYITEYGNLETNSSLGEINSGVSTDGYGYLTFTPNPNIEVQVRTFQISMQIIDSYETTSSEINLNSAKIRTGYGFYTGTDTDVKRAFGLRYKQKPIFQRYFDGSNNNTIDVVSDTISIPEHYFVTGEELVYTHAGSGTTMAIGIGTTSIVGFGITDKLPQSVYVVKINEQKIKLAASAEDALNSVPKTLDITNVGIGTSHTFTSKNQNGKCLIAIDNYIQSPIVATSVTSNTLKHVGLVDDIIVFSGITSFFSGDLIKIDDEIMQINTVGLGSTNHVLVKRPWMGTGLSTHSSYSTITKIQGDYNIVDNIINFVDAPYGSIPIGTITNQPDERDWIGITTHSRFQGRVFLKSGTSNSTEDPYNRNYIYDDISQNFDATTKTFTLTSNKQNIAGFSTNNSIILINGIFQSPTGQLPTPQDYTLSESVGITSITFTGTATSARYDVNNANIPTGGIIVSVGSTEGFGYQPLVAAGGTAVVSISGTISSISIGNSGSGYRPGIQNIVRVGVLTESTGIPNINYIGTASISNGRVVGVSITNPGFGYTSSNPPLVIFDDPLNYSNIPLIYSSSSPAGFGTEATIDIIVGQGSSIIGYELRNTGYNYREGQILTVSIGGSTGIPLDSSKPFKEFQISIDKTESDKFAGWNVGELEILDSIEDQFDGFKRSFTITRNASPLTIRAAKGSNIDIESSILVFLNDILQVPGESYTFKGGSVITFYEAPKGSVDGASGTGDRCKILFYKGNGDVDVIFKDVLETIKKGDSVIINDDPNLCKNSIQQEKRLVTQVISSDTIETNPYNGVGINSNPDCLRPITLCKQTSDKIINGTIVGKSRILYEALINPTTYAIQSVGIGSTVIFVDGARSFFNPINENNTTKNRNEIIIISQENIRTANASAVVSSSGTISSIQIKDGGVGYTTNPSISISNPVGLGTTALAISTISIGGTVLNIEIANPGYGYTTSNPPQILIETPQLSYEKNTAISYEGDYGIIVGIKTSNVGISSASLIFDLYIPQDSYLRNSSIAGVTTISGIQTGYFFSVTRTNVGNGVTSLYNNGSVLGISTQFLDAIYEVSSVSIAQTSIPGIASTYVARVTTNVLSLNSIGSILNSNYYGEFSWGKINLGGRTNPKSYNSYLTNGSVGVTTSTRIVRLSPLKYNGYSI